MSKQAINILIDYLTCDNPVMVTKWQNILDSYWHLDVGSIITDISLMGNDIQISTIDGAGVVTVTTIVQYQEPNEFPISKITDLQTSLDALVSKVAGKGLSSEDFTNALLTKLNGLNNYVHPSTHTIGEVDGLQTFIDDTIEVLNALNGLIAGMNQQQFLIWHGYRLYKIAGNVEIYPEAMEEIQGRGDGTLENGDNVKLEAIVPILDINTAIEGTDYKFLTSYS